MKVERIPCKCEFCGKVVARMPWEVRQGRGKFCSRRCQCISYATKHGMYKSPEYVCWMNMIRRCTYKKHPQYALYGGRGINVCREWLNFNRFFADMGQRPSSKHSLDRIDNNAGYSKANARWTTHDKQMSNTRKTKFFTHDGRTLHLAEWARVSGVHKNTLSYRLSVGWSFTKAIGAH